MLLSKNKIDLAMARQKFTKTELANEIGVSRNRLNVILNSRNITPATIGRIADALNVDVTEIVEE